MHALSAQIKKLEKKVLVQAVSLVGPTPAHFTLWPARASAVSQEVMAPFGVA
jgi:hypothetical protein